MTQFCKEAFLDGEGWGECGDCGLFFVNFFSFSMLVCLLEVYPFIMAKGTNNGSRNWSNIIWREKDTHDMKELSLSTKFSKRLFVVKMFLAGMVLLSLLVLLASIVESIEGYFYLANYLSAASRVGAWIVLSSHIRAFFIRRKRSLIAAVTWGIAQVIAGGMGITHYKLDGDHLFMSLSSLFYFMATSVFIVAVILHTVVKDDKFDITYPLINGANSENSASNKTVDPADLNSLFIRQQRKNRISYDAPAIHSNNDDNASVASSNFSNIYSQHDALGPPQFQRTASSRSIRSIDFSSEKMTSPSRPLSTPRASSKWSDLRGQFRSSGFGNDIAIRVVEWECFKLNENSTIALYRCELLESKNGILLSSYPQTVVKRHDELLFLAKKLSESFPNIDLPTIPVPPMLESIGNGISKDESATKLSNVESTKLLYGNIAYSLHQQEMNNFLSALLSHEVIGHKAFAELQSDMIEATPAVSHADDESKFEGITELQSNVNDNWETTSSIQDTQTHPFPSENEGRESEAVASCVPVPPLFHLKGSASSGGSVRVVDHMEGEAVDGSSDRTFFLVEVVSIMNGGGAQQALYKRTVKKKYKQFVSLNRILHKSSNKYVSNIAKHSFPELNRHIDGLEHKLSKNELVRELDSYVKQIFVVGNPHSSLLFSFLESDIYQCSSGYDVIFDKLGTSSDCLLKTVDTDVAPFTERVKFSKLRNRLFSSNEEEVLESSPPLNALGTHGVKEMQKLNIKKLDSLEPGDMTDSSSMVFSPSSDITTVVSDNLAKLVCLLHHVGGVDKCDPYDRGDTCEFLREHEASVLDWHATDKPTCQRVASSKSGHMRETVPSEEECGLWVSQWRLRRVIASTSAFADICKAVSQLKSLSVKQLKRSSDSQKISFLINLYNLISLHATVLLPWPSVSDAPGRCRWQSLARYQIGDIELSLLQIEYALLRSRLVSWPMPTVPHCPDVRTPSPSDIKHLSSLLPKQVDVRVLMALALPFRSSYACFVYLGDQSDPSLDHAQSLQKELFDLVADFLVRRIKCYSDESKLLLPKVLRRYMQDVILFRKSYEKHIPSSLENVSPLALDNSGKALEGCGGADDSLEVLRSVKSALRPFFPSRKRSSEDVEPRGSSSFQQGASDQLSEDQSSYLAGPDSDRGGWDKAAGSELHVASPSLMLHRYSRPSSFGDKIIAESEFQQLHQILSSELRIKDRTYHFKTYSNCFLGSDAVECLSNYAPGGCQDQALAIGNNLIEFGVMHHVVDDHWLKPKDLFYALSKPTSGSQITPFLSFIMHHIGESSQTLLSHQVSTSDDMNFSVLYLPEDFRFGVPLKPMNMKSGD